MRCIVCQRLSWNIICQTCQNNFLQASLFTRELEDGFKVYSFYKHSEIQELLNAKYHFFGDRIYKILLQHSFVKFAKNFEFESNLLAIAIDDRVGKFFSHTALLTKSLKSPYIKPYYNILKAQNKIKYAGKSLEFRKQNKRDFIYSGKKNQNVILVDDIITTGSTMLEAKETLKKYDCNVLFGIVLSDAKL